MTFGSESRARSGAVSLLRRTMVLEQAVRPGMRVVEIGSGPGPFNQVPARPGQRRSTPYDVHPEAF